MTMSNLRDRASRQQPAPATPGTGVALPGNETTVRIEAMGDALATRSAAIAAALSRILDLDIFLGRVMAEVRKTPDLTLCSLPSMMGCVVSAAQLGLEPGPLGHIYLTPRKNKGVMEAVLVIGYKGFIELARRAGGMSIDAAPVREHDLFEHERGTRERLTFQKAIRGDRGDLLGYWAAAVFTGGQATNFMRIDELHSHARQYSGTWPSGDYKGFAGQNWDAWCRKTAVRGMAWRLPQSNEMAKAFQVDEAPTYWRDNGAVVTVTPDGGMTEDDPAPSAVVDPPAPPPAEPKGWEPAEGGVVR
jgi:recombination protein RecT